MPRTQVQIAPDAEAFLNCPTQHPHDSPKFQLQLECPPGPSCLWDVPGAGAPVAVALGLVARLLLCADRPQASPPLPRGVTWVRCWVTPEPGHGAAPGHCQLPVQGSSGRAGSAPSGGTDKQGHSAFLVLCIFTQLSLDLSVEITKKHGGFSPPALILGSHFPDVGKKKS